jgi:hypothetical protein
MIIYLYCKIIACITVDVVVTVCKKKKLYKVTILDRL